MSTRDLLKASVLLLTTPVPKRCSYWVHIIGYNGFLRDDYGEMVEMKEGGRGQPQCLVRLFTQENEQPQWRRFNVESLIIEPVDVEPWQD